MIQTWIYTPSENSKFSFYYWKLSLGGSWSDLENSKKEMFFQISSGVVL
ncbi:hypothetical protein LEP1GSC170_1631 [Leptospira interrogans serovar Bataviae str. HAI135]|nr:hypothetical protein LEP1GSC170_1631 [Leptospira interrogans serovar Bataviae str. HAI135]